MVEKSLKIATTKTQDKYSLKNFEELLNNFESVKNDQALEIVEMLRSLAEFICYSEQYNCNYFDVMMSTNVLLLDMPRLLELDNRLVNT